MKPIDNLSDDAFVTLVRRAIAWPDAPAHLVRQVLDLWHVQRPLGADVRPRPHGRAVLRFDSWSSSPMAAGVRSLRSEIRQLLFAAEGCDVDLRISPQTEGFAISGQLLGPAGAGQVELVAIGVGGEKSTRRVVAVDALSEFRIDEVGSGSYRLTVTLEGSEIELPPIEVGPPRDAGGP